MSLSESEDTQSKKKEMKKRKNKLNSKGESRWKDFFKKK